MQYNSSVHPCTMQWSPWRLHHLCWQEGLVSLATSSFSLLSSTIIIIIINNIIISIMVFNMLIIHHHQSWVQYWLPRETNLAEEESGLEISFHSINYVLLIATTNNWIIHQHKFFWSNLYKMQILLTLKLPGQINFTQNAKLSGELYFAEKALCFRN